MSRAYRVTVSESVNRTLRAADAIGTSLEMLEVLPAAEMAELLRRELEARGFESKDGQLKRDRNGVTTTVDPETGCVELKAETVRDVEVKGQREGVAYDDLGPGEKSVRKNLQQQVQSDLAKNEEREQAKVQADATRTLEAELEGVRRELNQAVNRATAAALKRKAAQLGRVKEIVEDAATGSLAITVEV